MSDVYYQPDDEWWRPAPDYVPAQNGQPPQLTIRPKGNDVAALLNGGAGGADPNALQGLMAPEQPAVAQNALEQRGVIDKLLGLNGPRFQTWPERMVRSAATAPGEAFDTGQLTTRDPYGRVTDQQPVFDVETLRATMPTIERALDVGGAAFGGGMPAAVKGALGSAGGRLMQPDRYLLPAIKIKGKIYKGKIGEEHADTINGEQANKIADELGFEFHDKDSFFDELSALDTEKASRTGPVVRGYVNHKGQFLNAAEGRAGEYAVENGLIKDPVHEKLVSNAPFALTAAMLRSDSSMVGAPLSAIAKNPAFYSGVERALEGLTQKSATGDQWLNTLRNRPGVKPEELDWTGVRDYLTSKAGEKVSKDDLAKYMAEHRTEIKEVERNNAGFDKDRFEQVIDANMPDEIGAFVNTEGRRPHETEIQDMRATIADKIREYPDDFGFSFETHSTKFSQYQLPGGKNYRELLLTLPEKKGEDIRAYYARKYPNATKDFSDLSNESKAGMLKNYNEERGQAGQVYTSSHWDEPNVVAHVRMNDRTLSEPGYRITNLKSGNTSQTFPTYEEALTYANKLPESVRNSVQINEGTNPIKSLHLEEIQSDWHQQGKKQGYKSDYEASYKKWIDAERKMNVAEQKAVAKYMAEGDTTMPLHDQHAAALSDPAYKQAAADYHNEGLRHEKEFGIRTTVPDAPFKSTWADLALKRAISKAAREGYDAISWTPGEQQAARYDLSKQVSKVILDSPVWHGENDIRGNLIATSKANGNDLISKPVSSIKEIAELIGKEAADRLVNNPTSMQGRSHVLDGDGLKVGGEGMKAFYDKMLVDKANKLAKSMGGKVEWKEIPNPRISMDPVVWQTLTREQKNQLTKASGESETMKIPVLRLTPQMKQAAGTGFPLYMRGLPFSFTPVDHDPFKDQDKFDPKANAAGVEAHRDNGGRADLNRPVAPGPAPSYGLRPTIMDPELPDWAQLEKRSIE